MLTAIWAQDKNGLIGRNGHLPWRLPSDLQFFKKTTETHTLIMGRKTFEGMGGRPLPNRQTIVLTHDQTYTAQGILVLHSKEEVLDQVARSKEKQFFIAGGSEVYKTFIPMCDQLYRTVIDETFQGDAYFPTIDWTDWRLVEKKEGLVDEKNQYAHQFETYQKK